MVRNVLITLNYGPYEAHGIIRHKIQRLRGLIDYLKSEEYLFELNPTIHLNKLSVVMMDREIFRCDIRNLLFNMPSAEDPVCEKIIDVIKDHEKLFYSDRNIPQFVSVKEGMRWLQRKNLVYLKEKYSDLIKIGTPANSLMSSAEQATPVNTEMNSGEGDTMDNSFVTYEDRLVSQFFDFDVTFSKNDTISDDIKDEKCVVSKSSSGANSVDEPTICTGTPCFGCCPAPSINRLSDLENSTASSAFDVELIESFE